MNESMNVYKLSFHFMLKFDPFELRIFLQGKIMKGKNNVTHHVSESIAGVDIGRGRVEVVDVRVTLTSAFFDEGQCATPTEEYRNLTLLRLR